MEELNCRAEEDEDRNELTPVYGNLCILLRKLKRLELTGHWFSVPGGIAKLESELLPIQRELGRIDSMRVDGKFMGSGGQGAVPPGQAVLHFLLHKCIIATRYSQQQVIAYATNFRQTPR